MDAVSAVHPTDQALQSYGLGQLDDTSAGSVHAHLEGCPDCRRRVAELASDSFLGRLRDAEVPTTPPAPAVSATDGLSMLDGGAEVADPPLASTLPPGLADHPDYRVLRELGRGGMGVVYLAQNTLMGRMEVLKVVGGHLVSRPAILERFLREIRSAARLHHPNIVAAYAALRFGESLVLTMEYIDGLDLSRLVKARGPLPVANACNYVHQAATGLQHAHEHGMVHRDIKPANLILARAGVKANKAIVKVLDFGLAKVTSEGQADSGLTREGQMLGTPDYIAPEQIRDAQSADIRADIYSLGCTLYHLLTGKPPFRGDNLWDVYQAHFSMDAAPLNLARPEVPVELAALVAKMLAKEPGRRFQEPRDVAQALRPFFKSGSVDSVATQPDVSRGSPPESKPGRATLPLEPPQPATRTAPAAAPAGERPATTDPESNFGTPVEFGEPGFVRDTQLDGPGPSGAPIRRSSPTPSPVVDRLKGTRRPISWAAGVLLLGLILAGAAGVLKLKTANGVIVLEDIPADAVVEVDGERITVAPGEGEPLEIEKSPGKHAVIVKRGGTVLVGESVSLESGKRFKVAVGYEEPAATVLPAGNEPAIRRPADPIAPIPEPTVASPAPAADRAKPDPALDRPKTRKRLLAITESAGFVHPVSSFRDGRPSLVERTLKDLGKSGDFEVVASPDSRGWIKAEWLKDFDAVFFYTTGELSITPDGKAALLDFVRSGKGFAGVHSATDTLYSWPEYGDLIGAYFDKHSGFRDVTVRVDDPDHPSTRHLGASFRVRDELYQFKAPFSRDRIHILLHFEFPGATHGGAAAWTRSYGTGRVFYTALGHDEGTWTDERFRRHLLGGLRDVLGLEDSTGEEPAWDGWTRLFNGTDLSGWHIEGGDPGSWRVEGGAIVARGQTAKNRNYLLTNRPYSDFALRLEFRLEKGASSGVVVRAFPGETPFEKGFFDHPLIKLIESPGRHETGTMFFIRNEPYTKPNRSAKSNPGGSWNLLELEVQRHTMKASVNGRPIFRSTLAPAAKFADGTVPGLNRAKGRIGLQKHTGTVRFRNIMVKELASPRK